MNDDEIDPRAQDVLDFWFGLAHEPDYLKPRRAWFRRNPEFDEEIRRRFGRTHEDAAHGRLDHWQQRARSCLALILVLDQFSRNMFRDSPRAFACDGYALALAADAVARALDVQLPPVHRMFVYLPFEHSERLEDQRRSVTLFDTLRGVPELADSIPYAQKHYDVIARFGRFPHRNAILGRSSTEEELQYLAQPGSGF